MMMPSVFAATQLYISVLESDMPFLLSLAGTIEKQPGILVSSHYGMVPNKEEGRISCYFCVMKLLSVNRST